MEMRGEREDLQQQIWDCLDIARRRKVWVLLPIVTGLLISIYLMFSLPEIYESTTLILVEAPKVPQSVVKQVDTGRAEDRLRTIKQQILSRSFLQRIIDKFGLYEKEETNSYFPKSLEKIGFPQKPISKTSEEKIKRIRENVLVQTIGKKRLESFSISFKGSHPLTVMNVTNELANLTIGENLKIREAFVVGATHFLDGELKKMKAELERQESLIGTYKRTHIGELPEQLDANLRALDRYQVNLESILQAKRSAGDRLLDSNRPLENRKNRSKIMTFPLGLKLRQKREALTSLLIEYNEDYPDVILLRDEISHLEKQRRLNGTDGGQMAVYNQEVLLDPEEKERAKTELVALEHREREIRKKINIYERRVERTPKREQEMLILRRDYEKIFESYQALLQKKLNAEISESLEKRQKGEQFRVIDPANLPENPITPGKAMMGLMGIAIGLGVGIGLAYVREQFDKSVRTPEALERILSIPVLTFIPNFQNGIKRVPKEKRKQLQKHQSRIGSLSARRFA